MKTHRILRGFVWSLAIAGTLLVAESRLSALERSGASLGGRYAVFDPKDGDDTTPFGGAQMRFYMSPALALEGSIDYRKDEFANGAVEVLTWPVQASLLLYLMDEDAALSPFLLGGAGWYFTTVKTKIPPLVDESDSDDRFGLHAGGGLQLWFSETVSIDGTYRYIWLEAMKSQDTASLQDKEYNDSGHMITAGLNFHF